MDIKVKWDEVAFGDSVIAYELRASLTSDPNTSFYKSGHDISEDLYCTVPNYELESQTQYCFFVRTTAADTSVGEIVVSPWTRLLYTTPIMLVMTEPNSVCIPNGHLSSLHKLLGNDREVVLDLLYRASTDGFQSNQFKTQCHTADQTLVVIKTTNGRISGGFRPTEWGYHEEIPQCASFMFSLTPQGPVKYNYSSNQAANRSCLFNQTQNGISFGMTQQGKYAITVHNKQVTSKLGIYSGVTVDPAFHTPSGAVDQTSLFGAPRADIEEIELFAVKFEPSRSKV